MHWIVQENVCQELQWDELIRQLERFNIKYTIVKVVPFSGEMIPEPVIEPGEHVWCYGSVSMGKVARAKGWMPGYIDLNHFTFQQQVDFWGEDLLNNDGVVITLGDIHYNNARFYKDTFIRPIDDTKTIKGQVMAAEELIKWADDIVCLGTDGTVDCNTPFVISRPKCIFKEARFWVVNRSIVTWSLYKLGNTITHSRQLVDEDMKWFAECLVSPMMVKSINLPIDTFCLDIAEVPSDSSIRKFKIIEVNNINSSGLYDADIQSLVVALDHIRNY